MNERPHVMLRMGPALDLYHLSKVLTGFSELAAAGIVTLEIEPVDGPAPAPPQLANLSASIDGEPVVFDLYDGSAGFDRELLEGCSFYFKRSFYRPDVEKLPANLQTKVRPFGLNYGCRSGLAASRLIGAGILAVIDRYSSTRHYQEFEQSPEVGVSTSILFQTRAWAPDSTSDNVEKVNESRAAIIRTLRKAFPAKFHGGFISSPHVSRYYPDLVSTLPSGESLYTQMCKTHLIGISSRGLHNSVPFKLPEYIAGSMVIVSEPLRDEFPQPFRPGDNFLEFQTPEECAHICETLLTRPGDVRALKESSWRYYQTEVHPPRHMENILTRMRMESLPK